MSHWENASKTDQWHTPKYIFDAMGNPRFDLDVAAPKLIPAYIRARNWFWEDALEKEWEGFVWMNPPYLGRNKIADWLAKFVDHRNGICLVPDRTSAPWFQEFAPKMDFIRFVSPKIKFQRPDGTLGKQPGNGSSLMAIGGQGVSALKIASALGMGVFPTQEFDL